MKNEGDKKLFTDFPEVTTSMWEEKIMADLKGADYQKKLVWQSDEGIPVKPFYREEDIQDLEYLEHMSSLKNPAGEPNGWIICQDIFVGDDPERAHKRIQLALNGGAQAIRILLEESPVPSPVELEKILEDVHPGETPLYFHGCIAADKLYESLCSYASVQGVDPSLLTGSLGAHPLGKMAETGIPIASMENIGKLVKKVKKKSPQLKVIEVQGALIQNAGSTLVEELAFSLAMASDYLDMLTSSGIDPVIAQDSMQLLLSTGPNYFMEIAKLRAARFLWAKISEAYGIAQTRRKMFIHSISSEWDKTFYDPYVNMLRGTSEAMSSILGGADMVSVLPFDHPYGSGSRFSDRIARNVQLILREEAHFDLVTNPASGSYYIEILTDSVAEKAWELFCEVESMGGFRKAFESGWIQERVLASRKIKEERYASGKGPILGTNIFPNFNELIVGKLGEANNSHDKNEFHSGLTPLHPFRPSSLFEELRLQTEKSKNRPKVLLFKYGDPAWMIARAMFSGNFFASAGYRIIDHPPFETVEMGIDFCRTGDFDIVVLCSSDNTYGETAPLVQKAISGTSIVVVAGYPSDSIETLRKAGLEHFIHKNSNMLEILTSFNKSLLKT
jgi:methylmalonyl-CoA mutase